MEKISKVKLFGVLRYYEKSAFGKTLFYLDLLADDGRFWKTIEISSDEAKEIEVLANIQKCNKVVD